jgi:hypothetical protein
MDKVILIVAASIVAGGCRPFETGPWTFPGTLIVAILVLVALWYGFGRRRNGRKRGR